MPAPHKTLGELAGLREALAEQARERADEERRRRAALALEERRRNEFRDAMERMGEVRPLPPRDRVDHDHEPHPPDPRSRARDERDALRSSLSDEIDVDTLLDTDGDLSFCRPGIGPDVLRKLRRGEWSIQAALDLHGHRVEEAREETALFLREAVKRGLRCVRIVHGKGLGSKDRVPVLRDKVRRWLVQRDEVIAFCQARPAEGGAGALVVLLRPAR
ncbi:MAG TPA: Smr/MutS family protein [Burkholderiaceae bacterium]|jgi:DNA-nicking Smr family endonuclease|nr:Smr/MutS family protein [Burkholderiaceae bacterium]